MVLVFVLIFDSFIFFEIINFDFLFNGIFFNSSDSLVNSFGFGLYYMIVIGVCFGVVVFFVGCLVYW